MVNYKIMEHKTLLSEANEMRNLMKLPLIVEQKEYYDEMEDEEYMPRSDSDEQDYEAAMAFAREVRDWWKDYDENVVPFFSEFKGVMIDEDDDSAKKYAGKMSKELNEFATKLEYGTDNHYYGKLKNWIDEIVDQIDDWFQNPAKLYLLKPGDKEWGYFWVDPETD